MAKTIFVLKIKAELLARHFVARDEFHSGEIMEYIEIGQQLSTDLLMGNMRRRKELYTLEKISVWKTQSC